MADTVSVARRSRAWRTPRSAHRDLGAKLDGAKPEWPGPSLLPTRHEPPRKAMGADFVKVYNGVPNISRDAYLAIFWTKPSARIFPSLVT